MCQKNTHLTKSHFCSLVSAWVKLLLKWQEECFLFWATQACICNKRRMFLKFLERIFVRNYCDIFFLLLQHWMCVVQFALKMGLVLQKQSTSTVFYMQSLVPYSKVGLNKTTSVPSLDHMQKYLTSQDNAVRFPKFFSSSNIQHNSTEVNNIAITVLFKRPWPEWHLNYYPPWPC